MLLLEKSLYSAVRKHEEAERWLHYATLPNLAASPLPFRHFAVLMVKDTA